MRLPLGAISRKLALWLLPHIRDEIKKEVERRICDTPGQAAPPPQPDPWKFVPPT